MLKSGFMALAPEQPEQQESEDGNEETGRLVRGPAYPQSIGQGPTAVEEGLSWPTYRRDASRSGSTETSVSSRLRDEWRTEIGGTLTPPVTAGGVLIVAATEQQTVYALDAGSGRKMWSYTAGGRIDSPPTLCSFNNPATSQPHNACCIFGCRDGYVYCLRASDGELAWKYGATPCDRLITVDGQLESPWPVSGSVLVIDGVAYFAAGRNSFLDGGIFLHKVDAATGKMLGIRQLEVPEKERNSGTAQGFLPDVLASDGKGIFMRGAYFNRDNLDYQKKPGSLTSGVPSVSSTTIGGIARTGNTERPWGVAGVDGTSRRRRYLSDDCS